MALTLITVTADNLHEACTENWRRIYAELEHKLPLTGTVVLQGNIDFSNLYTIKGIVPAGPNTAYSNAYDPEA